MDPIYVIIVAYHGARWLPDCMATLRCASRRRIRLVLVDNGGNADAVPTNCRGFDYQVFHTARPLGFAEANNFALQQINLQTGLACFLNQDTKSEAGWLDACRDAFAAEPHLGAVVPLTRTYDDGAWDKGFWACARANVELAAALAAQEQLAKLAGIGNSDPPLHGPNSGEFGSGQNLRAWYEVPQVPAAAMVVRAEALRSGGPFDPIFGSYYEDFDLCRRIGADGYRIGVVTGGCVRHFDGSASVTPQARRRRQRFVVRNRAIHSIREAGAQRLPAVLRCFAAQFPYSLCRSLARTPSSQPLSVLIRAHCELLPLLGRLVSERRDRRAWEKYLKEIRWPSVATQRFAMQGSPQSQ